ncbi:MAG: hypothetical protein ACXABY_05975 [Candidatus Thorarchaeota archaeon]|jgi:hypothetical protein
MDQSIIDEAKERIYEGMKEKAKLLGYDISVFDDPTYKSWVMLDLNSEITMLYYKSLPDGMEAGAELLFPRIERSDHG